MEVQYIVVGTYAEIKNKEPEIETHWQCKVFCKKKNVKVSEERIFNMKLEIWKHNIIVHTCK